MRKWIVTGLILIASLILVSVVYAHFPGSGHGMGWPRYADIDVEVVKKFQKETLPLRDELITKKLEIRKEYVKGTPDRERIATLQKEVIDIRTKIQQKADEAGLPAQKIGGKGRNVMARGIRGKCCQCPMNR